MHYSILNSYSSLHKLTRIFDFSSDKEKIKNKLICSLSKFYIMEPIIQRVPLNINIQ